MDELLENSSGSIRIGGEDFEAADTERALSAVRNLHAGLLLLAKWVLVGKARNASEDDLLAVTYEPKSNDAGGVRYVPVGRQTIGLQHIHRGFKNFGLRISARTSKRLQSLAQIRNAVEHRYADTEGASLMETVSGAFVVAAELFRLGRIDPPRVLGEASRVLLDTNDVYQNESWACRATFAEVRWNFAGQDGEGPSCPTCGSDLVEQIEADNRTQEGVRGKCRSCDDEMEAEAVVESLVGQHYSADH